MCFNAGETKQMNLERVINYLQPILANQASVTLSDNHMCVLCSHVLHSLDSNTGEFKSSIEYDEELLKPAMSCKHSVLAAIEESLGDVEMLDVPNISKIIAEYGGSRVVEYSNEGELLVHRDYMNVEWKYFTQKEISGHANASNKRQVYSQVIFDAEGIPVARKEWLTTGKLHEIVLFSPAEKNESKAAGFRDLGTYYSNLVEVREKKSWEHLHEPKLKHHLVTGNVLYLSSGKRNQTKINVEVNYQSHGKYVYFEDGEYLHDIEFTPEGTFVGVDHVKMSDLQPTPEPTAIPQTTSMSTHEQTILSYTLFGVFTLGIIVGIFFFNKDL